MAGIFFEQRHKLAGMALPGLRLEIADATDFTATYDGNISGEAHAHTVPVGVKVRF